MTPISRLRALAGALRQSRRSGPPPAALQMRRNLAEICAQRGDTRFIERFLPDALAGPGGHLHIEVAAAAEARGTLVFAPGTNAYALMYGEALAAIVDRGFNVVGVDPRGHGGSAGRRGDYVLPELIVDLACAVDYARRRFGGPIFVAGSSQGGITAFYLAARRTDLAGAICHNIADLGAPDRTRLTRFGPFGRLAEPVVRGMARVAPGLPVPMTAYLDLAREPVRGLGNARDALYTDPLLYPCVRLATLASLSSTPLPVPVERIQTPILVLHGGGDTLFPTDYVEAIYRRLPGDRHALKVYDDLPHYLIVDHVAAWIDDVAAWMHTRVGDAP